MLNHQYLEHTKPQYVSVIVIFFLIKDKNVQQVTTVKKNFFKAMQQGSKHSNMTFSGYNISETF